MAEKNDTKQYLSISFYAFYIMECDFFSFESKNKKGQWIPADFLNRVFINFLSDEECAKKVFGENIGKKYGKEVRFIFRPRKAVEEIINRLIKTNALCSDYFYPDGDIAASRLFKSIYEEYALLPYYKREEIYFYDTISAVGTAIQTGRKIEFFLHGELYRIKPMYIRLDEWSSYNYIIGVDNAGRAVNARVAHIKELNILTEKDDVTNIETKKMDEAISEKGVQFLKDKTAAVRVRFTETGENMYNRLNYLRPKYSKKNEKTREYSFNCTERQAEIFFFKFGAEVEILDPKSLREKFAQQYRRAAALYTESI